MTNAIAHLDKSSSANWSRTLYAFLAEKERRSGSLRTVQSYSRMLTTCSDGRRRPPTRFLARTSRLGLRGRPLRTAAVFNHDRRQARLLQLVLPLPYKNERSCLESLRWEKVASAIGL